MSDAPKRLHVIVGAFVTVGLLILAGGILTIGNINDTFTRKISVTAVFPDVGGLRAGSNIWFSGVKVGTVKRVSFDEASQVEVEMRIDREAAPFIHNDTLAKVGSDGPIGARIIVLYDGTPGVAHVEDGDSLKIGEGASTDEIIATFQQNNLNLVAITADLKEITAGLASGQGTAGMLLSDDLLALQVSDTMTSLQATSVSAEKATAQIATFSAKMNRPGSLPHDLVTDDEIYPSLKASTVEVQNAATSASALVAGLQKSTSDTSTAVGALLADPQAGADTKATLANLSEGSRLLNEDLEAAQHSFLLRGALRKKAKADAKEAAEKAEQEAAR